MLKEQKAMIGLEEDIEEVGLQEHLCESMGEDLGDNRDYWH